MNKENCALKLVDEIILYFSVVFYRMMKQNHQLGSGHLRRVRVVAIGVC